MKAKEVVKNSQVEKMETDEVEGVPKPVPRAGKNWEESGGGGGEIKDINLHLHYTTNINLVLKVLFLFL